MISRRLFLTLTGTSLLLPPWAWTEDDDVPAMLDHILLGCSDLDAGIAFVERSTGVKAMVGGVHPGRGTRNALLSLGERHYLEIIAPDPKQDHVEPFAARQWNLLKALGSPRLIGWAAHVDDIEVVAKKLQEAGIAFGGPWPGSRARPDGKVLDWKSLNLTDDLEGVLPFYIEWGSGATHPSVDSPAGCQLKRFAVAGPDPAFLSRTFQNLGIKVSIEHADKPELHARIAGDAHALNVSS